jgi:hypothetical protein
MRLQSRARAALLGLACLAGAAHAAAAQKSVAGMIGKDLENAGRDVLAIWTAPFDGRPTDYLAALWLIGSAVAISPIDDDVDRWAVRNADASAFNVLEPFRKGGALYGGGRLAPVMGALYVTGIVTKRQDLRDAVMGCGATWGANHAFRRFVLYRLVGRERPDPTRGETPPPAAVPGDQYNFDIPNSGDWGWESFPGGHVANIAGCASFFNHRFRLGVAEPVLYAVAGAIWLSRTLDRAHWTSDEWLGAVFGYAIGKEVAHRQLKRDTARRAAVADGSLGALTAPNTGFYIAKAGDAMRVGWRMQF